MNITDARDLTQAERHDVFGTKSDWHIAVICEHMGIAHAVRKNVHGCIVTVWRSHLPKDMRTILEINEIQGVVYVGGWSEAA